MKMPKKKSRTRRNDKRLHAATLETGRPLCGAKSGKVSREPPAITCEACGREAVSRVEEELHARQRALEPLSIGAP